MKTVIVADAFGIYWSNDDLKNLRELLYMGLDCNGDEKIHIIGNRLLENVESKIKE